MQISSEFRICTFYVDPKRVECVIDQCQLVQIQVYGMITDYKLKFNLICGMITEQITEQVHK